MGTFGPYDVERELGRGGMGRVFLVRHGTTGAVRALKVLEGTYDPESVTRFRREATALARLAASGVVAIHDSGVERGRLWFAMDFMAGGSLEERLRRRGSFAWSEAAAIGAKLAQTLARVHELGLVHRDLKPANVLFDDQDEPRIADFGCVRELGASVRLTETGSTVGTPDYMAPEQLAAEAVDGRADVYALGCILFELVTGRRPYEGATLPEVAAAVVGGRRAPVRTVATVHPTFEALVETCLAPRASARLDARTLADALLALGRRPPPKTPSGSSSSRSIVLVLIAAVLGAVAAGLAVRRHASTTGPAASVATVATGADLVTASLERARAARKEGRPVRADDLARLLGHDRFVAVLRGAQEHGLEATDESFRELALAAPADPEAAALVAVETLRTGRPHDRASLRGALGRSQWAEAASRAAALDLADEIAKLHDKDDLVTMFEDNGLVARFAHVVSASRFDETTVDSLLDPVLRRLTSRFDARGFGLDAVNHFVTKTSLRDVRAGPRLAAIVAIAKQRQPDEGALPTLERQDPVLAMRVCGRLAHLALGEARTASTRRLAIAWQLRAGEIGARALERDPSDERARRTAMQAWEGAIAWELENALDSLAAKDLEDGERSARAALGLLERQADLARPLGQAWADQEAPRLPVDRATAFWVLAAAAEQRGDSAAVREAAARARSGGVAVNDLSAAAKGHARRVEAWLAGPGR